MLFRSAQALSAPIQAPSVSIAPSAPLAPVAGDQRIPLKGLRKRIAEKMVKSKTLMPHFTFVEEMDCTNLIAMRSRINKQLQASGDKTKLSYLPFICKALVAALRPPCRCLVARPGCAAKLVCQVLDAARAVHVAGDDLRLALDVARRMFREDARLEIGGAAGDEVDEEADGFVGVEGFFLGGGGRCAEHQQGRDGEKSASHQCPCPR